MSLSSRKFLLIVFIGLFLAACSSEPEVDVEATVAAALSATQTAVPTATAVPPTDTPIPTDTPTPMPTETAVPTDTPEPTATTAPESGIIETPLKSGDVLYEIIDGGFSFSLPPEWTVLDLNADNFADMMGAVGEQNDSLSFLSSDYAQTLLASGMKFYAINSDPESLNSGNPFVINVITEELPFELTASQYAAIAVGQLEQVFDLQSPIEETSITMDEEEIARLAYTAQIVNVMGIPIDVVNTQYIVIHEGYSYIVSVSVLADYADQYLEPARAAAETFHFLD
jgi:hypothetical protein